MDILFVCTGNTCRSPMAEGIFNAMRLPGYSATSAGISALHGDGATYEALSVCKENGIDLSTHRATPLTEELCNKADRIVCMTNGHASVLESAGINRSKISVLSGGISDPFGRGIDVYSRCFNEIKDGIKDLLVSLKIFTVNEYSANDIQAIVSLENECFAHPWSATAIEESAKAGTIFAVAKFENKIIGYGGVSIILDDAYITNIAVTKEFRNKGIGKLIVSYLCQLCESRGASFISLEVRQSNIPAISLYASFNFEQVGVRKNFYDNPKEDALIMTRRFLK